MNLLDNFFQNEYKILSKEKHSISKLIDDVILSLHKTWNSKQLINENALPQWPYALKKDYTAQSKYSISTNAMILCAVIDYIEEQKNNNVTAYKKTDLPSAIIKVATKLFQESENCTIEDHELGSIKNCLIWPSEINPVDRPVLSKSSTHGKNDPLTLYWLLRIASHVDSCKKNFTDSDHEGAKETPAKALQFINDACDYIKNSLANNETARACEIIDLHNNAFTQLSALRLIEEAKSFDDSIDTGNIYTSLSTALETKLHKNLSYFDIPDSRFDPAELIFCLEGMLICSKQKVSKGLQKRVLDVLHETQKKSSPFWRPVHPIYAYKTGQILLPLSIEAVNSLLIICKNSHASNDTDFKLGDRIDLFRRYIQWMNAQICCIKTSIDEEKRELKGWGSEHIANDDEIHLWQTSQILTFLLRYEKIFSNHIAQTSIVKSGLRIQHPMVESQDGGRIKEWEKIVNGDPIQGQWTDSILKDISSKFVEPRLDRTATDKTPCSFLLYGPPGTGKTRLAKGIALALNWGFLTITPSDFLAGGAAEVEQRAKSIFRMLEEQKEIVVLFDEIDHFLLDRESDEYRSQTGIFQFMTPGMLPKLQNLRDKAKIIFIVATNYAERIDSAIKRPGRIDAKYILLPPDLKARYQIITKIFKDHGVENNDESQTDIDTLAKNTPLRTWKETVEATEQFLKDKTEEQNHSLSFSSYKTRFFRPNKNKELKKIELTPWEETIKLLYILDEPTSQTLEKGTIDSICSIKSFESAYEQFCKTEEVTLVKKTFDMLELSTQYEEQKD